jgi:hypothetical protein
LRRLPPKRVTLADNRLDFDDPLTTALAKDLGHPVYPINVEGEFPIQRVANYAKANGGAEKLDALMASAGAQVKEGLIGHRCERS